MTELHWFGIHLTILITVVGLVGCWFISPYGPLAGGWKKQAHELEVKVRLHTGPEVIEYWRELAKLYVRLGRKWDGDKAFRSAIQISESQFGMINPTLIAVLDDYAKFLEGCWRKSEANTIRKRIKQIQDQLK